MLTSHDETLDRIFGFENTPKHTGRNAAFQFFFRDGAPDTPLKGDGYGRVVGRVEMEVEGSEDKGGAGKGAQIIDVILHYRCFNFMILICK